MGRLLRDNALAVAVWAGLVVATLVSWWLGDHGGGDGASAAVAAVVVVAFVKVRFVGRHFMELRDAPPLMRWIFDAYVVVVCAALVAIYVATS